jgi:hypothetical protein
LWTRWGDELPLFEASAELDPPIEKRVENAAWQLARAARYKGTIYDSDFDGTEKVKTEQGHVQSDEEMLAEATKIEAGWPHKAEPKPKPKPRTPKKPVERHGQQRRPSKDTDRKHV